MENVKIEVDKKFKKLVKGSKNTHVLAEFNLFCVVHKELRFWQALSAWIEKDIKVGGEDAFYWKGKKK